MHQKPEINDALAVNYANLAAKVLRNKFNNARIARSLSSSLQVLLSAFAGAGASETFSFSQNTISKLGFSSALIPNFQNIFNAKGRAQAY